MKKIVISCLALALFVFIHINAFGQCQLIGYNDNWIGSDGDSHHAAFYRCPIENNYMVVKTTFGFDEIVKSGDWGWDGWKRDELGTNIYMVLVDGWYFWKVRPFYGSSLDVYRTVELY